MSININIKDLSALIQEDSALTRKPRWDKADERRHAFLLGAIAAVKVGARLADIETDYHNERSRAAGMPAISTKNPLLTREQEQEAKNWREFVRTGTEFRDVEGSPMLSHIGTYTGLGYFVPNEFFPQLFRALKAHDAFFDEDVCTVIKSTNGRVMSVPVAGDTENVASVLSEAGSITEVDVADPSNVSVGVYSYSTPRWTVSLEAFDDLPSGLSAIELFRNFSADRIARGVGKDLTVGNGTNKPLGIVPSLAAITTPIIAVGSADNTGLSETGANSLGSNDFMAAFQALDAAYIESPRCAWFMNNKTLGTIVGMITKYGQPLDLVKFVDGQPTIYGKPVKICPSMDGIGASNTPVIFGDASYWCTRLVVAEDSGVATFTNAPGLAENGQIGLRTFVRAGGSFLWNDTGSPCPFVMIQNHS